MRPKWGAISFDELAVNKFLAATFHVRLDVCYRYGGKSDCGFALCVCVKDLLMAFGEQHNIICSYKFIATICLCKNEANIYLLCQKVEQKYYILGVTLAKWA